MSMALVHSKALSTSIQTNRIIGHIEGGMPGPTVIFFAGIHGNEPSGVFAMHRVFEQLKGLEASVRGNLYALAGNLSALAEGKRFHHVDLNRLWTEERMERIKAGELHLNGKDQDSHEQMTLLGEIERLLNKHEGPFFFFDLHTTSSQTTPFIFINDTLYNRKLATRYPVPVILGIEESIEGPLLSYINQRGYMAVGYEAGQHDDAVSIDNHESFAWSSLVHTGLMNASDVPNFNSHQKRLRTGKVGRRRVYEIRYRCEVTPGDEFEMNPGYRNFQAVHRGEVLAYNRRGPISANETARVFMPLYQAQGEDGFFLIRGIHPLWLWLSAIARKWRLEGLLARLPGISRAEDQPHVLTVDIKVARWLATDIFHLLGYRKKIHKGEQLLFIKREYDVAGVGEVDYTV